jgi:hypothetical protein
MNNLVFFYEDGKVKTELQECTLVEKDDKKLKCFNVLEKPVYLRIFLHDDLFDFELKKIYVLLEEHKLTEITKKLDDIIQEDMEMGLKGSSFEIVCRDFREAFMCGCEIREYFTHPGYTDEWFEDERVSLMLSDEPSEGMKNWLNRGENTPLNEGGDSE